MLFNRLSLIIVPNLLIFWFIFNILTFLPLQFTAWLFTFLTTLPATIQELHSHGKRLAEEKDRALAQQGARAPAQMTESIPVKDLLPSQNPGSPGTSPKPQQVQQQPQHEHEREPQAYHQYGVPLPIPRDRVDQSAAGVFHESHAGAGGSGGAWQEKDQEGQEFRERGESYGAGERRGEGENVTRHDVVDKNVGGGGEGGVSNASPEQGINLQSRMNKDMTIDESGLYSSGAGGGGGERAGGERVGVPAVPAEQGTSVQSRIKERDLTVDESGMHSLE
jgi:hypothetical protein